MLSTCCATAIEIHTDPKSAEYIITEGADRNVGGSGAGTRYGDEKALDLEGTIEVELQSREERDEMLSDPFAKLERGADGTGGRGLQTSTL
jgi:coiled-coil domain-containing protein 130